MEELKARETLASSVTMDPCGMAWLKDTLFTEAVTTIRLQCLWAAMAQAMSMEMGAPQNLARAQQTGYSTDVVAHSTVFCPLSP